MDNQEKDPQKITSTSFSWKPWELFDHIQSRASMLPGGFEVDQWNRQAVKALCHYFTGCTSFEKMSPPGQSWKLHKGLLITGNTGAGKTTLMQLFKRNTRQCYQVVNCRQLNVLFAIQGYEMLGRYSVPIRIPLAEETFYQQELGTCFDDLGVENDNVRINVMAEIILNRYENSTPWHYTYITTSLTAGQIKQRYGSRVQSKVREMFNMIVLPEKDCR